MTRERAGARTQVVRSSAGEPIVLIPAPPYQVDGKWKTVEMGTEGVPEPAAVVARFEALARTCGQGWLTRITYALAILPPGGRREAAERRESVAVRLRRRVPGREAVAYACWVNGRFASAAALDAVSGVRSMNYGQIVAYVKGEGGDSGGDGS